MSAKVKLADRLHATLRRQVETGEWPEGTRIPPETVLAQIHGVSRPVVREALIRLRADGIIGARQGSGNFVTSGTVQDLAGYPPIENVADLIQTFEFRFSVECDVAAMAALRSSPSDLAAIRDAARAVVAGQRDDAFGDADFVFHLALAQASGNGMYETTLNMLRSQIVFGMRLVGGFSLQSQTARADTVSDEHEAIVSCIATGDPAGAQAAMASHLLSSRRRILGFDLSGDWPGREPRKNNDNRENRAHEHKVPDKGPDEAQNA